MVCKDSRVQRNGVSNFLGMEANIIQMSAGPDITSESLESSIQILLRIYI